jgi:hypothetical protein
MILDRLEETRPLYSQERNFRTILKNQILKLLNFLKEYWQQRYTVRWTKLGNENTKFFHAAATERYRINSISSLDTTDGLTLTTHEEKAAHVRQEYRNRLACTLNTDAIRFTTFGSKSRFIVYPRHFH